MKTPIQEMLEWVRTTLPMDLDFPQMIERKIESLLEKEKEQMIDFANNVLDDYVATRSEDINKLYGETFNTK